MPATEDSVLTSLNELRRLRKERRKKGHSARGAGGNASSQKPAAAAYDRMGDQVTPPPRSDLGVGAKGVRAGLQAGMEATARAASAGHGFAGPAAATWDAPVDPAAFARMAQPKSSAKPAIVVAVVLLAAAGAGYMKLQNDTQALLDEKNANIRRVEDARAQAVEAAAQAERQAQAKLKACEAKAPAAQRQLPRRPSRRLRPQPWRQRRPRILRGQAAEAGTGHRRVDMRLRAAPAPSSEPTAVPHLPRKKKLDNDPLAGIKI